VRLHQDDRLPDSELTLVRWEKIYVVDFINGLRDGRDAEVMAILTSRDAKIGSTTQFLL
jgi:hypothetical protein